MYKERKGVTSENPIPAKKTPTERTRMLRTQTGRRDDTNSYHSLMT